MWRSFADLRSIICQQLGRDGQRVRRLSRSRGRDQQEVAPGGTEVLLVRILLPGSQRQQQLWPDGSFAAAAIIIRRGRGGTHKAERLPAVHPPRLPGAGRSGASVLRTVGVRTSTWSCTPCR